MGTLPGSNVGSASPDTLRPVLTNPLHAKPLNPFTTLQLSHRPPNILPQLRHVHAEKIIRSIPQVPQRPFHHRQSPRCIPLGLMVHRHRHLDQTLDCSALPLFGHAPPVFPYLVRFEKFGFVKSRPALIERIPVGLQMICDRHHISDDQINYSVKPSPVTERSSYKNWYTSPFCFWK